MPPIRARKYTFKKRNARQLREQSALQRDRNQLLQSVETFVPKECCKKFKCFANIPLGHVRAKRREMLSMNQVQRKETLKSEFLAEQHMCDDEECEATEGDGACTGSEHSRRTKLVWEMCNRRICTAFMCQTLQVSKVLLDSVKGTANALASQSSRRLPRYDAPRLKAHEVTSYLDQLSEYSERMPDTGDLLLPMTRKCQVYLSYVTECRGTGKEPASISYFIQVWCSTRSYIKCRRHHRFTKCDLCEELESKLRGLSLRDESTREALSKQLQTHWDYVRAERQVYYNARDKSRASPSDHMSIIIDGADQTCYKLPHWSFSTKGTSNIVRIGVKLIGALVHGQENNLYCSLLTDEYPCGANSVIEMLHRTLTDEKAKRESRLPRKLHLQLDNCSGQNKNKYLMSYCESLVILGVFEHVRVMFLPVGHTHEDIDQAFSRIALHLRETDAITMLDLVGEIQKSYNPSPSVTRMLNQANFSGLLENGGYLVPNPIQDFSTYRSFSWSRITADTVTTSPNRKVYKVQCLISKHCSTDQSMLLKPQGSNFGVFLKRVLEFENMPPTQLKELGDDSYKDLYAGITKCVERIGNTQKVTSLRELIDSIHEVRSLPFHWNLINCIEYNGNYRPNVTNSSSCVTSNPHINSGNEDCESDSQDEIDYDVGDFVATLASGSAGDSFTFWIGRVEAVLLDERGKPRRLKLRWYDSVAPRRGKNHDQLKARYKASTIIRNGRERPSFDEVSIRTVLCCFNDLRTDGTIRIQDQSKLSEALDHVLLTQR